MRLRLHPDAELDVQRAALFYEERAGRALANALLDEYERALGGLLLHPLMGSVVEGGLRRIPLKGFPYSIFYEPVAQEVRVMALAHQSRRPGYWLERKL
ncbi:MAG: type II toxin-antitoxin system RelE/ParE family toxin [Halothiobacillaceae bacterium]